jgi:RNA polymerase sigma factor (sigma-70 family)
MSNNIKELLSNIRSGDQEAFNTLLHQFDPLIHSLLSTYRDGISAEDVEEMYGEAAMALYSSAISYDADQDGVEFGLYAKICVKNRLVTAYRKYMRRARLKVVPLPFDEAGEVDEKHELVAYEDPSAKIIEQEALDSLTRKISDNLSEYENRIWWLYMSGLSAKEVAESLTNDGNTVSERSVSNALYRIRKKLRAALS